MIDTVKLLSTDDNGSVREGACQTMASLLQMSMVGTMGTVGSEGESKESTDNESKSTETESLSALLLSKAALKDPSTDVRTAACCAIMKVARDTKTNFFGRMKVRKILQQYYTSPSLGKMAQQTPSSHKQQEPKPKSPDHETESNNKPNKIILKQMYVG